MKRDDILIPLAWGHQPEALPADANKRATSEYYKSALNAGYLEDADYNPATGKMRVFVDAPGLDLDTNGNLTCWTRLPGTNQEVKTAIREVSGFITPNWRDGKGRDWKDSLAHVALTPRPVVHGQGGFQPAAAVDGIAASTYAGDDSVSLFATVPAGDEGFYLSTSTWTAALSTEADMADDATAKTDDTPAPDAKPDAKPPEAPVAPAAANVPYFSEFITGLQKLGLHLPPDTTPANLFERGCAALHALDKGGSEDDEDPANLDDPPQAAAPVTPEAPPIMMSTVTDPVVRRNLADIQDRKKKSYLRFIDRMAKDTFLSPVKAERLRNAVGGYELSLNADATDVRQELDVELSTLIETYKESPAARRAHVANAEPAPGRPETDTVRLQMQEKAGDELAARTMTKTAK